jgi:hypothetical protein
VPSKRFTKIKNNEMKKESYTYMLSILLIKRIDMKKRRGQWKKTVEY